MTEYKITEESKAEAKELFSRAMDNGCTGPAAFAVALDALCVPVKEDNWKKVIDNPYPVFYKGKYRLVHHALSWRLSEMAGAADRLISTVSDRQAPIDGLKWADAEIAKYEGRFRKGDRVRLKARDQLSNPEWKDQEVGIGEVTYDPCTVKWANGVYHIYPSSDLVKVEPSSFGPGTRLRASNGDELLVVEYYPSACSPVNFMAVNLTHNCIACPRNKRFWESEIALLQALEKEGATIIG